MIKKELKFFFAALTFFTRLPSPFVSGTYSGEHLNGSAKYFSLIGWVVGGLCALALWISEYLLPHNVSIVLSMITGILVTGAFHEDGFADTCDGFGGGWNKERILEIMKDSRIGSYGAIGLIMILLTKYLLLFSVPFGKLPIIIFAAHSISRWASTLCIYTHEYVGNQAKSKAKPLCSKISTKEMTISSLFGIMPLFLLGNYQFLLGVVPVLLTKWRMTSYFKKWIGGYTGDCLGAIQQVTEIIFYLTFLIIWKYI